MLVAFYHSEYTPTQLPSVATYQHDVQKFVKLFPHVRQYQSWDEANRGNVPGAFSSPSAVAAAHYYQALMRVCKGCTVIGLDVLDAANIGADAHATSPNSSARSAACGRSCRRSGACTTTPTSTAWKAGARANSSRALGGQVWLTETGGIVQFGGAFPNSHGSGLTRAAKVLKYMFAVAGSHPADQAPLHLRLDRRDAPRRASTPA